MQETKKIIEQIINDIAETNLSIDKNLTLNLRDIIDSMSLFEAILIIEEEQNIDIKDLDVATIITMQDLVNEIFTRKQKKEKMIYITI